MITTVSSHNFRAEPEHPSLLLLPFYALRALHAALHGRRWRRAAPFAHLNEHLRRDIGLPPLGDERRWR
jgi:hypothetical protein